MFVKKTSKILENRSCSCSVPGITRGRASHGTTEKTGSQPGHVKTRLLRGMLLVWEEPQRIKKIVHSIEPEGPAKDGVRCMSNEATSSTTWEQCRIRGEGWIDKWFRPETIS